MNRSEKPKRILRLLFWESTTRCNLMCTYCRRLDSGTDAFKDLSTTQARNLIEQLAELGKFQQFMPVLVFSGGEPFCRNDLFDLIGSAALLGISSAVATNGTMVDTDIAKKLRNSGVTRVSVSLDAAKPEIHDKLRGIDGSFSDAVRGIGCLRCCGVEFQVNITLTGKNAGQLNDVYELSESLGAHALHVFILVPLGCGRNLGKADMLTAEQIEDKMLEITQLERRNQLPLRVTCGPHYHRVISQQGLAGTKSASSRSSKGCLAGQSVLFVNHRGDVFPCGYLPVNCGSVLNRNLQRIWCASEQLARMRDSEKLEGKCGLCDYKEICGGCRARAYAATGNYMAEDPFCAYIPQSEIRVD
ncbi:MAG: radical SAM protein [Planctomycetota bacterium]